MRNFSHHKTDAAQKEKTNVEDGVGSDWYSHGRKYWRVLAQVALAQCGLLNRFIKST